MIDQSLLKGIQVDPDARTVRVQGGALWRDLDHETQAFGLASTGGTVSNTGVAGLTTGGGLGWLMGKHGLAIDNLLSADIVTADGQFRKRARALIPISSGPFAVAAVTSASPRRSNSGCTRCRQVLGGLVLYPLDQARDVLRFYRDFCATLPDEAEAYAALLTTPRDAGGGVDTRIQRSDRADGEKVLAPARRFGTPIADLVGPIAYATRQKLLDEPNATHGLHRYWRSAFVDVISDDLIDAIVDQGVTVQLAAQRALVLLHARRRHPRSRGGHGVLGPPSLVDFDAIGEWTELDQSDDHPASVRTVSNVFAPHLGDGAATSTTFPVTAARAVARSYGSNLARLRAS